MFELRFTFLAGRYHATPWGAHVNEGQVEWPPSPWRIARAFLAVGFTKLGWSTTGLPPGVASLLNKLCSATPEYELPLGTVAHTRHYLPFNEGSKERTTLVLDTFLRFGDDCLLRVFFPVQLTPSEYTELARVAQSWSYLGRAETWVEVEAVDHGAQTTFPADIEASPERLRCSPHPGDQGPPLGKELVSLLSPVASSDYDAFRSQGATEVQKKVLADGAANKPPTAAQKKALEAGMKPYPKDLLDCLCRDSSENRAFGWSQPPGSRLVPYLRPTRALEPSVARPRMARASQPTGIDSALLRIDADTATGMLRPLLYQALPLAEALHGALVSTVTRDGDVSPSLSGRDADGNALQTNHGHAHLFPVDLDEDGRVDHVLIHAPMGFDDVSVRAIRLRSSTWAKDLPRQSVTCVGLGTLRDFRSALRDRRGNKPSLLEAGTVWQTLTPFLAPRHLKPNGKNSLIGQVLTECASRGLPTPSVEVLSRDEAVRLGFLRFQIGRKPGKPQSPDTRPWALRLEFPQTVEGPFSLGFGSHFGLGVFVCVPNGAAEGPATPTLAGGT